MEVIEEKKNPLDLLPLFGTGIESYLRTELHEGKTEIHISYEWMRWNDIRFMLDIRESDEWFLEKIGLCGVFYIHHITYPGLTGYIRYPYIHSLCMEYGLWYEVVNGDIKQGLKFHVADNEDA